MDRSKQVTVQPGSGRVHRKGAGPPEETPEIPGKKLISEISELKKSQLTLQENNKLLKSILDGSSSISIISTDRNGRILFWNTGAQKIFGYTPQEAIGRLTIGSLYPDDDETREKVQTVRRCIYEEKRETSLEIQERTKDGKTLWIKLTACPRFDEEGNVVGILGIGEDVTERREAQEEQRRSLMKLKKTLEDTVEAMSTLIETKDPYTSGHQRRVAMLACEIAREMDLTGDRIEGLYFASIIHDVGKIYVPSEILCKPGWLTGIEIGLIKTHPQVGYDILRKIEFPWPVAQVVLQHHERLDGSGYPHGRTNEQILLEARILGVADVVEAMATHRPYRPSLGVEKALDEIEKNSGLLYDDGVVAACMRLFREKGFSFD
jgi:PAS domain S-box-containing protein